MQYIIRKTNRINTDTPVIGQSMIGHSVRVRASRSVEWLVTAQSVTQTKHMESERNIHSERYPE